MEGLGSCSAGWTLSTTGLYFLPAKMLSSALAPRKLSIGVLWCGTGCEELTTSEEFLRHGSYNLGAEGKDHVGYDGSNGKDVDDGLIPPTL